MGNMILNILFVEDSEKDVALMLQLLINEGREVYSERVSTAAAMISAMNNKDWNLIVSNDNLVDFDVNSAFDILKSYQKKIPFIVVADSEQVEVAVDMMKKGVDYYLSKSNLATLPLVIKNELSIVQSTCLEQQKSEDYYSLFETAPIAMWEEDFSEIKKEIDALKAQGVTDFEAYFRSHEEKLFQIVQLLKVSNVNLAAVQLQEASSKKDLLDNFNSIFIKKSIAGVIWQLLAIASGDKTCEFDSKVMTLKSRERDVHIKWRVADDYEENYGKVFLSIIEITERRRAQDELREKQAQLELIYDNTRDLIFLLSVEDNNNFKWVSVNQAFCDVTGLDLDDLDEQETEESIYRNELKAILEKCQEVISSKKPIAYEEILELLDRKIILETTLTPIFDSAGNCTHLLAVAHNITQRKDVERKLKVSKREVEKLFELSPDFMFKGRISDLSIVRVNLVASNFYGYKKEEFEKMKITDVEITPQMKDILSEYMAGMAVGEVVEIEGINKKKDGTIFPAHIRVCRLDEFYVLASIRDMTEYKKMEQELRMSNNVLERYVQKLEEKTLEFDRFFKLSRDMICIVKPDGYMKRANSALSNTLGYSRSELFSRPLYSYIHPDDLQENNNIINSFDTNLSYSSYENRYKASDGSYHWLSWRCVLDTKTKLRYLTARDVTEEKRANREIEDIRNALNQSSIVAMTCPDGKIIYVNDAFCIISQYSRDELLGESHRIVNSGHHHNAFMKALWDTISKGNVWRGEIKNRKKDGTFYWTDTTIVPQLDVKGNVMQYIAIRRDISQRKFIEEELDQSQKDLLDLRIHIEQEREKERARIALDLHDDLGQKLTALNLGIGWLNNKLSSISPEVKSKMDSMSNAISDAVNQVQAIASELRPSILDNLGLADAVAWQLKEFEKSSLIKTSLLIRPNPLTAKSEIAILVFRIVQESLTNIARHAQATRVVVRLIENKKTIRLSIKDNGIGIKESELKNPKSFGLRGMEERTKWGRGAIFIRGDEGKGTEVMVEFPLH